MPSQFKDQASCGDPPVRVSDPPAPGPCDVPGNVAPDEGTPLPDAESTVGAALDQPLPEENAEVGVRHADVVPDEPPNVIRQGPIPILREPGEVAEDREAPGADPLRHPTPPAARSFRNSCSLMMRSAAPSATSFSALTCLLLLRGSAPAPTTR